MWEFGVRAARERSREFRVVLTVHSSTSHCAEHLRRCGFATISNTNGRGSRRRVRPSSGDEGRPKLGCRVSVGVGPGWIILLTRARPCSTKIHLKGHQSQPATETSANVSDTSSVKSPLWSDMFRSVESGRARSPWCKGPAHPSREPCVCQAAWPGSVTCMNAVHVAIHSGQAGITWQCAGHSKFNRFEQCPGRSKLNRFEQCTGLAAASSTGSSLLLPVTTPAQCSLAAAVWSLPGRRCAVRCRKAREWVRGGREVALWSPGADIHLLSCPQVRPQLSRTTVTKAESGKPSLRGRLVGRPVTRAPLI